MSDQKAQQEPSMEEILASIRRIISEDDETPGGQPGAAASPDTAPSEPEPMVQEAADPAEPAAADEPDTPDTPAEPEATPEPAELAEPIVEEVEPEPVAEAEEPVAEQADEIVEEAGTEAEDDVLELTELADEESIEEIAEPELEAEVAAEPADDMLISEDTASEASNALSRLSESVEPAILPPEIKVGGADSLEGLVRQMLRPLLQEWLDENLPAIVEEAVQQEVKRLSRNQRGRG